MGGLATSLVGKGHSPRFYKGHQDNCGVWGVLEDKCQAAFSQKMLEAVLLVGVILMWLF